MVLFDLEPHIGHHAQHLGAQIGLAVDRRHREIAAFDRRAVAGIAVGELLARDIGPLGRVDRVHRPIHAGRIADIVKDKEFRLGAKIGGVADPGGDQVLLGFFGGRARVAGIGLAGQRLVHIAKDDQRGLRRKRIQHRGRAIRHQHHVALVDRLPPGDRRAVKHDPLVEKVLIDRAQMMRQMLPLAARIGKPEVDIFDFVLLDQRHHIARVRHLPVPLV